MFTLLHVGDAFFRLFLLLLLRTKREAFWLAAFHDLHLLARWRCEVNALRPSDTTPSSALGPLGAAAAGLACAYAATEAPISAPPASASKIFFIVFPSCVERRPEWPRPVRISRRL